jgi:hypothetical protein
MLYIHIDPGTRQLLYIGRSCMRQGATAFGDRTHRHRDKLRELLAEGWRRDQIAHVVVQGMNYVTAQEVQMQLIGLLHPPMNITSNPDFDWWANPVGAVLLNANARGEA